MPALVQLDGTGPFVTPTATGCLGLVIPHDEAEGRARLSLVLEGGQELHIPMHQATLDRVLAVLRPFFESPQQTEQ